MKQPGYKVCLRRGRNLGSGLELPFGWPLKHCSPAVSIGPQDVPLKANVEKMPHKALA